MKPSFEKYIPFKQINLPDRQWPNNTITKAPIWCSVDLRDGNQALVDPMNLEEKLEFFHALCDMGFKEIEIGFPSASETEYEICRELIENNHIPDDVTIQVLVQAREHLIRKTFEAVKGAKNVIVHFYNSTSTLQRKVVFKTDMDGVIKIAVDGAKLIKQLTDEYDGDTNFRFEYSPESFSGTEPENAVEICDRVIEALGSTAENKLIVNLPNTVEMCTPNTYADQIEYFARNLKHRDAAIISIHPHNDRGCGVAAGGQQGAAGGKVEQAARKVGTGVFHGVRIWVCAPRIRRGPDKDRKNLPFRSARHALFCFLNRSDACRPLPERRPDKKMRVGCKILDSFQNYARPLHCDKNENIKYKLKKQHDHEKDFYRRSPAVCRNFDRLCR